MTKTTETKATPIAELTPERFNARFPIGTRVATSYGDQEIMGAAARGAGCCYVQLNITGWNSTYNTHPIVTLGSLNPGDEFRWHDETPGAGVYRVKGKSPSGIVEAEFVGAVSYSAGRSADTLVQVVALNLAQDRPEVFPGTMLREGDVVEYVDTRPLLEGIPTAKQTNSDHGPFTFRDGNLVNDDGGEFAVGGWHFRLVPATIPAPAPTEPCPAPEPSGVEPARECARCGAPENKYRKLSLKRGLCLECSAFGDPRNNGTFLPPKPPRNLPPAVAYHLNDDCDASGIPGHH